MASSRPSTFHTGRTGPKTSSVARRESSGASTTTAGWKKCPGPSSASPPTRTFAPPSRASPSCAATRSRWAAVCIGPMRSLGLSARRSEEHTSELQSLAYIVCRLLLEKKNSNTKAVNKSLPVSETTRAAAGFLLDDHIACFDDPSLVVGFFFNDTATTEIYTLSLHDALPI